MKNNVLIFLLICLPFATQAQPKVTTIQTSDLIQLVDSSSTPIIISFWATWCSPCLHEIPWLEKSIAAKSQDSITLVLVCIDGAKTTRELEVFVARKGFRSRVVLWQRPNFDAFALAMNIKWTEGIPATYLRNNKRNRKAFFNRQLTEAQIDREFKKLVIE